MALNNIGTLHEEEGRLDSALYYYNAAQTAGEGRSRDARANSDRIGSRLSTISRDLMDRQAFGEARALCAQFLSIDPNHREALFCLSIALFLDGMYGESISVNEQLVSAHPEFGEGYLQLGNALQTVGRSEEAGGVYRRLVTATDDDAHRQEVARRLSRLDAAGIK